MLTTSSAFRSLPAEKPDSVDSMAASAASVQAGRTLKPSEYFRCQFIRPCGYWVRASDGEILRRIHDLAYRA